MDAQAMAAAAAAQMSSPLVALAQASQQFDPREAAALGLQGWDLQQLALYLLVSTILKIMENSI